MQTQTLDPKISVEDSPEVVRVGPNLTPDDIAELRFQLGLWIRGLEAFCAIGRHAFPGNANRTATDTSYKSECRIVNSVLLRCSEIIYQIVRFDQEMGIEIDPSIRESEGSIKMLLAANAVFVRSDALRFDEWHAWCRMTSSNLRSLEVYLAFERDFPRYGEEYLPKKLIDAIRAEQLSNIDRRELRAFAPRFGGLLRSLETVGEMLRKDVPLKPSLAIFAFVYEAANELVSDINDHLARLDNERSELFGMLDAASYTTSIELKKAFSQELSAIIGIRPATTVFARVESAYGVMNDSIRQLLAGFARLSEPGISAIDIFPDFHVKLEQSIELRSRLWDILEQVRKLERSVTPQSFSGLKTELKKFLGDPVSFLFYKDRETFERFCNEIIVTGDGSDVGPVLHRFSAYVETLFGQVGMRAVLSNHPFEK